MKKSSYAAMSIDALLDAKRAIEDTLIERAHQLRKQLASLGARERKARKGKSLKGRKVAPKYRGPDGETWAGRGAQPLWLRGELKKGRKLDSFLIGSSGKKAATKKTARKAAKKAKSARKKPSTRRAKTSQPAPAVQSSTAAATS